MVRSATSDSRTEPVKTWLRWVETLILVMPAAIAACMPASDTPEDPCSTSGTDTASRMARIRSSSRCASRVVMACEEPTATANRSTPVSATKAAASAGDVRADGSWTPFLPPTSPSSASTSTPAAWHSATIALVVSRFAASGSFDPSYMTEETPSSTASATSAVSSAWSRCTATGTDAARPTASVARQIGSSAPWYFTAFSEICSTTGRPARSAALTKAVACSRWITLKAPNPVPARWAARASSRSEASISCPTPRRR